MSTDVASHRAPIFEEIDRERERQISLGFTPEHDREHGGLTHILHFAESYVTQAGTLAHYLEQPDMKSKVRFKLLQAAALLVAAIEYLDSEDAAWQRLAPHD